MLSRSKAGGKKNIQHDVFRNMRVLVLGAGSAKLVGLIAIPILTRLYTPNDFGVLSIFTSIILVLAPASSLRYVMAIPLPRSDKVAANLLFLSVGMVLVSTAFYSILIWFLRDDFFSFFSIEPLAEFWWLISFGSVGLGFYEILNLWATRKKRFKAIAKSQFLQVFSGVLVKVGFGIFGIQPLGIVVGHVIQLSGGLIVLLTQSLAEIRFNAGYVSKKIIHMLFFHYKDFPRFRLPTQLLVVLSSQFPLLFFAKYYSTEAAGQLALAVMAISLPVSMLGQTAAKAYYAEVASLKGYQKKEVYGITCNVMKRLFIISLVPTVVLVALGEWGFLLVFGSDWEQAGVFASLLALYLPFQFLYTAVGNSLVVVSRLDMQLANQLTRVFLVASGFVISLLIGAKEEEALLIYSALLSISYACNSWRIISILRGKNNASS